MHHNYNLTFNSYFADVKTSLYWQGLISGSAETKEQAAEGLGELIDVTSEQTLKDFIVPITGYDY